jgi:CheY-like chemotaxis protein
MVSTTTSLHGRKAMKKLERIVEKGGYEFPDVILLDIDMPVMNGFEFLAAYQEAFHDEFPNTLICMLSASIRPEDKLRAKEYSFVSHFIRKPLSIESFQLILTQRAGSASR